MRTKTLLARRISSLATAGLNDRALDRAFFGSYGGKFSAFGIQGNLFEGASFYGASKVLAPSVRAELAAIEQMTTYGYDYGDLGGPISSNFLIHAGQYLPSVGFSLGQFYQPYDEAQKEVEKLVRSERIQFVDSDYSRDLAKDSRVRYTGSGIDEGPKSNKRYLMDIFNAKVRMFKGDREAFDMVMKQSAAIMASPDVVNEATVRSAESAEKAFTAVLSLGPQAVTAFVTACKNFATYWGM